MGATDCVQTNWSGHDICLLEVDNLTGMISEKNLSLAQMRMI